MKTVILAGGLGSRISEESQYRPKPMIEIGGMPILWHIMKYYSAFGHNEFIICAGYKQQIIKEFFSNYYLRMSDVTFDFTGEDARLEVHSSDAEPWRVTVADTGLNTFTAGRIRRIRDYVNDEPFMLTYGDGLSDVDLNAVLEFHNRKVPNKKPTLTLTAVRAPQRFGVMEIGGDGFVSTFREKSGLDGNVLNGGFMVVEPTVFDEPLLDEEDFSKSTLESLAEKGTLSAYRHEGFWHPMDTQRDRDALESIWASGSAPWKVWK